MTPILAHRPRTDRAFERLYKRHVTDVYRYALVVLRNPADAEDVTQTTFMNAYRAYERGERPRAPRNWLIAIAHNVCRQRFRQSSRRPQEVEFDDMADHAVPDDDTPTAGDIKRALGHLAFNQRAALVMREIEGRSYPEIAEILGVSVGAVETLVFRARRALREQLEGSLTCHEAERAVSRQLDGRLSRAEKGPLRAHLRECEDCARFARSQRAQRSALRAFAMVPLPTSLASFFGGSSAGGVAALAGGGLAAKGAAVLAAGVVVSGVSYAGAREAGLTRNEPAKNASAVAHQKAASTSGSQAASTPVRRAVFGSGVPGFIRNAAKPGRRVGPKEPVRSRIVRRKQQQAARKAARRQQQAIRRSSPRVKTTPPGRARQTRPKPTPPRRPAVPPGQPPGQLKKATPKPPPPRRKPPK